MDDLELDIAAAREAYRLHDWPSARAGFSAARAGARAVGTDLDGADLAALADAAWWLGLVDEAVDVGASACFALAAAGRLEAAAGEAIGVAVNHVLRAEEDLAAGWIARASDLLSGEPDSAERGYLRYLLEIEPALDGPDPAAAATAARHLREFARGVGDPSLLACATQAEGRGLLRAGSVDAGLALLDEAMGRVTGGEVAPAWAGHIYCTVMAACAELADYGRARRWTAAAERWLSTLPAAVLFTGICRVHRAQLLRLEGDWRRAEAEAVRVCGELADISRATVAEAYYEVGEVLRMRGALAEAETAYRRAHVLGRPPQPGLALLRLAQGRPDVAAAAIRAALTAEVGSPLLRAPLCAAQVEIALAGGDPATARKAADELDDIAARYASSGLRAAAAHAAGRVHLAEGRAAEALPLLRAASSCWHDVGAPYETAQVRLDLACAHSQLGDDDTATLELDAALTAFTDLGAGPAAARVRRLRQSPERLDGLTARELDVLRCLSAGRSNRQIAVALGISEKTVARHLANIFAKLGLPSRTAVAAYAFEHDLLR